MKIKFLAIAATGLMFSASAFATGLATCESGPQEDWVSKEDLKAKLEDKGWDVRKIKEDGGCWEVYAMNAEGERVEAYFHPETLERIAVEDDHH